MIVKKWILIFLFILFAVEGFAQRNNGKINSLINAESYFNNLVFKKSINKAFLKIMDDDAIVFRPNVTNGKAFYNKQDESFSILSWKPEYAMISKSADFGFTTGPYVLKTDSTKSYGHYLSVWQSNEKNKWKLILDAGIAHEQPDSVLISQYIEPSNNNYYKWIGPQKIKMREDIVLSTDILLGKALYQSGLRNLYDFYDPKVRFYFPGSLPVLGRDKTLGFIQKNDLFIKSTPIAVKRAFSGDLAYTYGTAEISQKKYNYVRIWKISEDSKWNIIIDFYILFEE